MDERARRIEAGKRRSLSRNFALARRIGRRPGLVQKFRRTRSLHRAAVKTPRAGSPSGSRRFSYRIVDSLVCTVAADKPALSEAEWVSAAKPTDRVVRPSRLRESGKPEARATLIAGGMMPQFC